MEDIKTGECFFIDETTQELMKAVSYIRSNGEVYTKDEKVVEVT